MQDIKTIRMIAHIFVALSEKLNINKANIHRSSQEASREHLKIYFCLKEVKTWQPPNHIEHDFGLRKC